MSRLCKCISRFINCERPQRLTPRRTRSPEKLTRSLVSSCKRLLYLPVGLHVGSHYLLSRVMLRPQAALVRPAAADTCARHVTTVRLSVILHRSNGGE